MGKERNRRDLPFCRSQSPTSKLPPPLFARSAQLFFWLSQDLSAAVLKSFCIPPLAPAHHALPQTPWFKHVVRTKVSPSTANGLSGSSELVI